MIIRLAGFDARKCAVAVSGLAEVRYILALKHETSAITLDANSTRVRAPSSFLPETARPIPSNQPVLKSQSRRPLVMLERL